MDLFDVDTTPACILEVRAEEYRANQMRLTTARKKLAQAVRDAVADGMSQSEAARIVGVDRLTIKKWISQREES